MENYRGRREGYICTINTTNSESDSFHINFLQLVERSFHIDVARYHHVIINNHHERGGDVILDDVMQRDGLVTNRDIHVAHAVEIRGAAFAPVWVTGFVRLPRTHSGAIDRCALSCIVCYKYLPIINFSLSYNLTHLLTQSFTQSPSVHMS